MTDFGEPHFKLALPRKSYLATWLERVVHDVRSALRSTRREPMLALAIVVTLGLGIGLNTGVFTILYSLLLRPLPLPQSDRLVTVHQLFATARPYMQATGGVRIGTSQRLINESLDLLSYPEYQHFQEHALSFEALDAFAPLSLTVGAEIPASVTAFATSCDYFRTLGVSMPLGRGFAADECARRGEASVVVLSYGLWQGRLGGDPSAVGSTVTLNGQPFTVIGVAQQGFAGTGLQMSDLWIPISVLPLLGVDYLNIDNLSWLHVIGRLQSGATIERTRAELTTLARQLHAGEPDLQPTVAVHRATVTGPVGRLDGGGAALVTMALVTVILLLACLNITNLLLSRAPVRRRSVCVRLSLGGQRRHIVMQLLTESIVLGLLGGAVGLVLSMAVSPILRLVSLLGEMNVSTVPDVRVLAYAFAVSLASALAFGLMPAIETTRVDLATALRSQAAGIGGNRSGWRLRRAVVSVHFAGSLVLLVIAGLFVRAVSHGEQIETGYRMSEIYAFHPQVRNQGYDAVRGAAFLEGLRVGVAALPGVENAALTRYLPLQGSSMSLISREGLPPGQSTVERQVFYTTVSPEYFELMDIPILRGRTFDPRIDDQATVPAVISEETARRYWGAEDPVGRGFRLGETPMIVVGVARDVRHLSLTQTRRAFLYAAWREHGLRLPDQAEDQAPDLQVVARVAPGTDVAAAVLRLGQLLDPAVAIEVESLEQRLAALLEPARLSAWFAGILGVLAALLAVVGIYSALAYAVAQRSHELGVRLAIGANRRDIVILVMRQGLTALVPGLVVGVLLAVAAGRVVRSQLFGVPPFDPIAFGGVILLLLAAALVAIFWPARRASLLDPIHTLRNE
jgi:predicted permease